MATYKEIIGTNVESRSSDPSNPVEGQVWYNSTTGALKGASVSTAGAWSTGGSLNNAKDRLGGGAGTSNSSALVAGGYNGTANVTDTELYDGSTWTEVNNLNTARGQSTQAGTQTSAIIMGGSPPTIGNVEIWDGTNWTETTDLNTTRRSQASAAASNTAALCFGGYTAPPFPSGVQTVTESWNGSSWTEVADLNSARYFLMGAGIYTSALAYGGDGPPPGYDAITESWNGSTWTEVGDMNSARFGAGSTNGSSNTSALCAGGEVVGAVTANTEEWNGSSWTEVADLSNSRYSLGGAGTSTSGIVFGGDAPGRVADTEEWNGAGAVITRTFTTS